MNAKKRRSFSLESATSAFFSVPETDFGNESHIGYPILFCLYGLIFVYPVEEVIRIRTGESGHEALAYEGDIDTRAEVELAAADYGLIGERRSPFLWAAGNISAARKFYG